MSTTARVRLVALVAVALLVGLAALARPHPAPVTRAEQDRIDRLQAAVEDRKLAALPPVSQHPVSAEDAAVCLRAAGFRVTRRGDHRLTASGAGLPASTVVVHASTEAASAAADHAASGRGEHAAHWVVANNVRLLQPRGFYASTTEQTRRAFYDCIDPAD